MAKAVINLQKESGGIVKISPVDGTGVTEVTVPESGNLVSVDTAVTDNAIARYDGTTGKLQNSGVIIDDSDRLLVGNTPSGLNTLGQLIVNQPSSGDVNLALTNKTNDAYSYIYNDGTALKIINSYNTTAGFKPIILQAGSSTMTLGANGNLLVGTTTDDGANKLQINGTFKATGTWNQLGDLIVHNHYRVLLAGFAFSVDFVLLGDSSYDIEIIRSAHNIAPQYNRIIFTQMASVGQYKVISNDSTCTVTLVSSTTGAYRYTVTISSTGTYNGYTVCAKQRSVSINSIS